MRELKLAGDRPARYRAVAQKALARLSKGDPSAATLHRARTHLRRLQAYLELVGGDRQAASVAECVARLSKLRTLQVFAQYLKVNDAPRSDRKAVKRRLRAANDKLARARVYATMEQDIRRIVFPSVPADPAWLAERMGKVRDVHARRLRRFSAKAGSKPGRKALHRLRLAIKSMRYQEEWAQGRPFAMPGLARQLKHAQKVLGDYEDLVHFRKLAKSLGLRFAPSINKAWRKARARARALPSAMRTGARKPASVRGGPNGKHDG